LLKTNESVSGLKRGKRREKRKKGGTRVECDRCRWRWEPKGTPLIFIPDSTSRRWSPWWWEIREREEYGIEN
jgi:hypothetical protein